MVDRLSNVVMLLLFLKNVFLLSSFFSIYICEGLFEIYAYLYGLRVDLLPTLQSTKQICFRFQFNHLTMSALFNAMQSIHSHACIANISHFIHTIGGGSIHQFCSAVRSCKFIPFLSISVH